MLTCHLPVNVQQLEVKAEQSPAPNKKEAPPAAETNVSDAPSGKKKNSAKKQKTEPGNEDESFFYTELYRSFSKNETIFLSKIQSTTPAFCRVQPLLQTTRPLIMRIYHPKGLARNTRMKRIKVIHLDPTPQPKMCTVV